MPKISVITPSLNQGRFLRNMIESVMDQSFKDFEHIIVDGGSTDETIDIIREYPHLIFISQKDESVCEAYIKATSMATGKYIIQCCTSDGFLYKDWFMKCVEIMDGNDEISMVWGVPQYMSEDGFLRKISTPEYFDTPPPQKQAFLPFWLATGHVMYEGNQCTRRDVFVSCFPKDIKKALFKDNIFLDFVYTFITQGYLPYFVPIIANYGRIHHDAITQIGKEKFQLVDQSYLKLIRLYKKRVFSGGVVHHFRDGSSCIIGSVGSKDLPQIRKKYYATKIRNLTNITVYQVVRYFLRRIGLWSIINDRLDWT
jgi:glycosyltransferase involved in cell wall biosynthesis